MAFAPAVLLFIRCICKHPSQLWWDRSERETSAGQIPSLLIVQRNTSSALIRALYNSAIHVCWLPLCGGSTPGLCHTTCMCLMWLILVIICWCRCGVGQTQGLTITELTGGWSRTTSTLADLRETRSSGLSAWINTNTRLAAVVISCWLKWH